MTFILKGEGLIYIYYLAVDPGMRRLGYGSSVLDGLKAMFPGCRFALSSESPDPDARNLEERLRRISFYERNGFADSRRRDMWGGGEVRPPDLRRGCGKGRDRSVVPQGGTAREETRMTGHHIDLDLIFMRM